MTLEIRRAVRQRVWLKLAVMGPSGSGKTLAALALAKGLVGDGKILVVDTENASASCYADRLTFDVIDLAAPFTSQKYQEALIEAVKRGYQLVVFDSLSHEWMASGGVLDVKARIDSARGEKWGNWQDAKRPHAHFKEAWLQAPIHVIATLRSKTEYVLEQNDRGKAVPRKVGLGAAQEPDVEYDFTVVFDIDRETHVTSATKDRTGLFDGRSFELATSRGTILDPTIGQELKAWRESGIEPAPTPAAATPTQATGTPAATVAKAPATSPAPAVAASPAQGAGKPPAPTPQPGRRIARERPQAVQEPPPAQPAATVPAAPPTPTPAPKPLTEQEQWLKVQSAGGPVPTVSHLPEVNPEFRKHPDWDLWVEAMVDLSMVMKEFNMPGHTQAKLRAEFDRRGPESLADVRKEVETIRSIPPVTTPGAAIASLPQPPKAPVPQAVSDFVDDVDPDVDEGAGGISKEQYELLGKLIEAHAISRDCLRTYMAKLNNLLPGKNGPTLARMTLQAFTSLREDLGNTGLTPGGKETWAQRRVRIINATPATYTPPVS